MRERQVSFAGGELAPTLWGRTDLTRYPVGARRLSNLLVTPHAVLTNRPGTKSVGKLGQIEGGRIVPFVYSNTDTALLYFVVEGCWVLRPSTLEPLAMLSTPYTQEQLGLLRFAQIGNKVTVVCPGMAPMEIRRGGPDPGPVQATFNGDTHSMIYALPAPYLADSDVRVYRTIDYPIRHWEQLALGGNYTLTPEVLGVAGYVTLSSTIGSGQQLRIIVDSTIPAWTITELDFTVREFPTNYPDGVQLFVKYVYENGATTTGYNWIPLWPALRECHKAGHVGLGGDGITGFVAYPWEWAVTHIMKTIGGEYYETAPYVVTHYYDTGNADPHPDEPVPGEPAGNTYNAALYALPDSVVVEGGAPREIWVGSRGGMRSWGLAPNGSGYIVAVRNGDEIVSSRVYRGRNGVFGFLGETTGWRFVDDGSMPDMSIQPPKGRNPFVPDGITDTNAAEFPAAVTYFEGRRYFGVPSGRVNASEVDDFSNFDDKAPAVDSDALEFTLSHRRQCILSSLVARDALWLFTNGAIFKVGGSGVDEITTPNSIACRPAILSGSGSLDPVETKYGIFFMSPSGIYPQLLMDDENGKPRVLDVSLLSRHLFDGFTVIDWAWAQEPYSTLWAVRSDGKLLALTYVAEQEMLAWSVHELSGGGLVESIAVLPSVAGDVLYLSVNYGVARGRWRYLESLSVATLQDILDATYLDRHVTYDGRHESTDTMTLSGDMTVGGGLLVIFSDVAAWTGLIAGTVIQIASPAGRAPYQLILGGEGDPGAYGVTSINSDLTGYADGAVVTAWAVAVPSVTGLTHLEGQQVYAFADGNVLGPFTVQSGSVSLGDGVYAAVVHVGLSYTSEFESLDAIQERGKVKNVSAVTLELDQSLGGEVGTSLDSPMQEIDTRDAADDYGALQPRRVEQRVLVEGEWGLKGRIAYRQTLPVPVTILGLTREYELGG